MTNFKAESDFPFENAAKPYKQIAITGNSILLPSQTIRIECSSNTLTLFNPPLRQILPSDTF